MSKRKYFFLGQKKIIFIGVMQCVREREIAFQFFFFFLGKQHIENKSYFYKSFPLTKDSFPLTFFIFIFFMLPNTGKYGKLSL